MAHTPGPWFVADWADDFGSNFVTIEARSKEALEPGSTSIWPSGTVKHRVASTEDGENPIDDARLIAASPEMFCALQCIMDEVGGSSILSIATKEQAKAALAKARGEHQ